MIIGRQGERGVMKDGSRSSLVTSIRIPSSYRAGTLIVLKKSQSRSQRVDVPTADKWEGGGGSGGLSGIESLSVNWKPRWLARNLPEIPIDRGILQQGVVGGGRAGVRMPRSMTAIFYTAGGQSPQHPRP